MKKTIRFLVAIILTISTQFATAQTYEITKTTKGERLTALDGTGIIRLSEHSFKVFNRMNSQTVECVGSCNFGLCSESHKTDGSSINDGRTCDLGVSDNEADCYCMYGHNNCTLMITDRE